MFFSDNFYLGLDFSFLDKFFLNDFSFYGEFSYFSVLGEFLDSKDLEEDIFFDFEGSGFFLSSMGVNGYEDMRECIEEINKVDSLFEEIQLVMILENKFSDFLVSLQQ